MREKILFMGAPGTGKSTQLFYVARYLSELGKKTHVLDLEDKFEALLLSELGKVPDYITLKVATDWDHIIEEVDTIITSVKPNDWIMVDRADLAWPSVQRWYTKKKYNETLAEKMLKSIMAIKKSAMVTPRFDSGSWQVINESYEGDFINRILFESRCNVVICSGIKGVDENSPLDIYGNLGVIPRGQKELGHQPNSVFLLHQKRESRQDKWLITTAKDLKGRVVFQGEDLMDFSLQYLAEYYKP